MLFFTLAWQHSAKLFIKLKRSQEGDADIPHPDGHPVDSAGLTGVQGKGEAGCGGKEEDHQQRGDIYRN